MGYLVASQTASVWSRLLSYIHCRGSLWDDFTVIERAVRRLVAPLILVCVLVGCSHAPRERTLSVSEIVKADNEGETRGQPVRTTAIVTYSDPDWRRVV